MKSLLRIVAVAAIAALCVFLFGRWVVVPYRCNAEITRLTGLSARAENQQDTVDASILARDNLTTLYALRDSCPTEINLYMLIAQNQQALGQSDQALATYRQAVEVYPRPEIYVAMARLLLSLGRMDEAKQAWNYAQGFTGDGMGGGRQRRGLGKRGGKRWRRGAQWQNRHSQE